MARSRAGIGTPPANRAEGCYLLHFERAVHGAQHYLGWSVDIARRVRMHLNGRGARLVRQALRAGIGVELVRVWPAADRKQERLLKVRAPKRYCPKCRITLDAANEELPTLLLALQPRANRRKTVGRCVLPQNGRAPDVRRVTLS